MSGFGAGSSSEIFLMISSYLGRGQPLYLALFAFLIYFILPEVKNIELEK